MQYGLIGEHLQHSFSTQVHSLIGEYDYQLVEVAPDELVHFLKERNFRGINVTIPYKQAVMPLLDHISDEARRIGAVNTIVNRDGALWGYNTDCFGFAQWAAHLDLHFSGRRVLILGRGGAAKAAAVAANDAGASLVQMTGRDSDISREGIGRDYDCIINATPVGMFPQCCDAPLVDIREFSKLTHVLDCIYNPLRTRLLVDAKIRNKESGSGILFEGGLYMLVAQAVKAASLFLGKEMDEALTESIFRKISEEKENIVLIGMPTCGKTTMGRALAKELGREFFDTDELVVERVGKSIPEIFATQGEAYFREVESEVINKLASRQNCVIATGGGAVLNPANIANLMLNGRIKYLYKELTDLEFREGRPLLKDTDSFRSIWEVRHSLYLKYSDEIFVK